MRKIALAIATLLFLLLPVKVFAISEQPYIVLNFASINELNWAAPEDAWVKDVKPQVITQIRAMRSTLSPTPVKSGAPILAWSTLMEYMNYPLDTPSEYSPYAIKMRRILEIAQDENFPVFVPLNGFQWWDELPELYNWWDSDGTKTDPAFFARQDNPEDFKKRFIAGYNPDNKWNVEWQSWNIPMKLNYRNWGGGGFRLAPPPNLVDYDRTKLTYRGVQRARLKVITDEIEKKVVEWNQTEKSSLFAGLSIGTEVSLNASVLPADEFEPYGYRSIQDTFCPENDTECGKAALATKTIQDARIAVVDEYLTDNARMVMNMGIPKNSIYTHVWSESLPGDKRYTPYIQGAFNLYSRAGMSFYGYAKDPLSHPDFKKEVVNHGAQPWGAVEYSAGNSSADWLMGLSKTVNNTDASAGIVVIYNWDGLPTQAVAPLQKVLQEKIQPSACDLPEIEPITSNYASGTTTIEWKTSSPTPFEGLSFVLQKGIVANEQQDSQKIQLDPTQMSMNVPADTRPGSYVWYLHGVGCLGTGNKYSEPRLLTILPKPIQDTTPKWVKWILHMEDNIKRPN